jgi:predicted nucleotide-binding protein
MANHMTIRESDKRRLIELINQQLAQDNPQLTPIVQDAARLALICREPYYYMLFQAHINGGLPTGDQLAPSFQDETLREKVLKDFQSDRIWSFTIYNNPLHDLEEQCRQFQQRINEMAAAQRGEPPRSELIWDRKTETDNIVNNIRERVETFITELESPSRSLVRTAEVIDSESPMRKDGRIFIGHGGSFVWMQLKEFLKETLGLQVDEFNRESPAGRTTVARLQEMLDVASLAFLIMTAEDEHADNTVHARENVIHEIGLFQGKLGFEKAIVLLEDGCTEFSNIHGLTVIPFPKGKIMATAEEIRRVLAREGIRSSTSP